MTLAATTTDINHPVDAASQPVIAKRHVCAAVMGNAFEFYDFACYTFFTTYIAKAFFPSTDSFMSILEAVGAFGIGFVTRPVGGLLIGRMADRKGRRAAMLLTMMLMAVGTLGLALTPSYHTMGIAAPVLIIFFRMVQGVALGGEIGSVSAYLIESAPASKRGLYGSWLLASQGIAMIGAGMLGVVLVSAVDHTAMQAWGWRIPFAVGVLLIPVAVWLRLKMPESLSDEHFKKQNTEGPSVREALRGQGRNFFTAFLISMGSTIPTYVGLFMTTYAAISLKLPPVISMTTTVVFGLSMMLGSVYGGYLSDLKGRKPIIYGARILLILMCYPGFYYMIHYPSLFSVSVVTFVMGFLTSLSASVGVVVGSEIFPTRIRALLMAVIYAVVVSIFGGTTQAIVTWLIGMTGNPISPAWFLIATSLISLIGVYMLPETRNKVLSE